MLFTRVSVLIKLPTSFSLLVTNFCFHLVSYENFQSLITLRWSGNESLYGHRTWKYIAKTEVEIFLTVMVSMVTV